MIIVTGGAGFIGSNLIAHLEQHVSDPLVVCDTFDSSDKWRNLLSRRVYDIIHPDDLFDYLEQHKNMVRVVFHMGANSSTTERNVDLVLDQNFRYSKKLLIWCGRHRVRLVYASSAATYGDGSQGFDDVSDLDSLKKFRPLNPYAWSKHLFDMTVAQIREGSTKEITLPPQVVGLKFFNVYGPNEYHKGGQMSVVPQFVRQILEHGEVRLFKSTINTLQDGNQQRDFIHVDDCTSFMLWLLDYPEVNGLFNVGTGTARSFNDIAQAIFVAMNREPKISYTDMPPSLAPQYQSFTQANTEKLAQTGYTRPALSLELGVKTYVQNHLLQADPYR